MPSVTEASHDSKMELENNTIKKPYSFQHCSLIGLTDYRLALLMCTGIEALPEQNTGILNPFFGGKRIQAGATRFFTAQSFPSPKLLVKSNGHQRSVLEEAGREARGPKCHQCVQVVAGYGVRGRRQGRVLNPRGVQSDQR